jgi:membrane-anchored protein YejM (alkaline phosphatase superfamily)
MTFMFFESPHARYFFPPESAIRKPYLEELNYATMSLTDDIELIRNRYINSCHYLDSQLQRVINFLRQNNLLASTIVVITGDHGEEFMEKGRWGHNSAFHQEQIKVPLILWVPGHEHAVIENMTSHLDISPTILRLLGVKNPRLDFSLGYDLLARQRRQYTVVNGWSDMCYIDNEYKAVFSFKGLPGSKPITTRDDQPLEDKSLFFKTRQANLLKLMKELSRFRQH